MRSPHTYALPVHLKGGYTPLHDAARNESPQAPAIVEALLKAKAKTEATDHVRNQEGDAALMLTSPGGAVGLDVRRWHEARWAGVGVGMGVTLAVSICVGG